MTNSTVRSLPDVNVLVALAFRDHTSHQAAHKWFTHEPKLPWASCALTQAGFLRVATRALGGSRDAFRLALAGLEHDCATPEHEYWPVDTDLRGLTDSQRLRLTGPNQITDMQLVLLAHRHRGKLVTFDKGISTLATGTRYANHVELL